MEITEERNGRELSFWQHLNPTQANSITKIGLILGWAYFSASLYENAGFSLLLLLNFVGVYTDDGITTMYCNRMLPNFSDWGIFQRIFCSCCFFHSCSEIFYDQNQRRVYGKILD